MTSYIVHALCVFGFAYLVGASRFSLPARTWIATLKGGDQLLALLECPACLGAHVGWILALAHHSPFPGTASGLVAACCFCMGTSFILGRLTGLMPDPAPFEIPERHIEDYFKEQDGTRNV